MKIFYCCSFRFKVLRTETSWSFMNFQIYNCRCGRDFMPVLYNIMRYCKSLDIMRRYEKLLQTLCKLQITRLGSVILPKATILDKKTLGRCFPKADDCISWMLSSTKWLHPLPPPPPPLVQCCCPKCQQSYSYASRVRQHCTRGGGGGGFSEVILEIVQHSLYLMCLSE